MTTCALCGEMIEPHAPKTWKQVSGFVGGPKKDHMRLREDTGLYAHEECVLKLASGQAIDQPSIFDNGLTVNDTVTITDSELPEELR